MFITLFSNKVVEYTLTPSEVIFLKSCSSIVPDIPAKVNDTFSIYNWFSSPISVQCIPLLLKHETKKWEQVFTISKETLQDLKMRLPKLFEGYGIMLHCLRQMWLLSPQNIPPYLLIELDNYTFGNYGEIYFNDKSGYNKYKHPIFNTRFEYNSECLY